MSWGRTYSSIKDFIDENPSSQYGDVPDDVSDAVHEAVGKLLDSNAAGHHTKYDFTISTSGHWNPNHEPASGMANDFIQVSILQKAR